MCLLADLKETVLGSDLEDSHQRAYWLIQRRLSQELEGRSPKRDGQQCTCRLR